MTSRTLALFLPLLLCGCISTIAPNESNARARLGQTARLGLISVTPTQVIEDSRCVRGTQCIWAGQVRVRASVDEPSGNHLRTLTLGKPEQIAGGTLLLSAVTPERVAEQTIPPGDYSFIMHYTMPTQR